MRSLALEDSLFQMVQDFEGMRDRVIAQPDWNKRYPLSVEPPSALFCDGLAVTPLGYRDGDDPLNCEVLAEIHAHWTPHGRRVLDMIADAGAQPLMYARTGAVYQTGFQNKKRKRLIKQADQLTRDKALAVYFSEYYSPMDAANLIRDYAEQSTMCVDLIDQDPERLLVGKPVTTGTGWRAPWNDRENMCEHWGGISDTMRNEIPRYLNEVALAAESWPMKGAQIILPADYRGIRAGARSDGSVERWSNSSPSIITGIDPDGQDLQFEPSTYFGTQQISSQTRQVGNDPSSVLFGPGTIDRLWTQELWSKYSSMYHVMPFEKGAVERFIATPPPADWMSDDDFVVLTADWGYQDHAPYMDHGTLVRPDAGRSLGADNIVFQGIQLLTGYDYHIYMLESGQPFTMMQYLVTAGAPVARVAYALGYTFEDMQILQVGDDINIRIKKGLIGPLLDVLGPWLKLKGIVYDGDWMGYFLLGHYSMWKSQDETMIFVAPRAMKSVSSANNTSSVVPDSVVMGQTYIMHPTREALDASAQLASRMPNFLAYRGKASEWEKEMLKDDQFYNGKLQMADIGYSEYLKDILVSRADPGRDDDDVHSDGDPSVASPAEQTPTQDVILAQDALLVFAPDLEYRDDLVAYMHSYGLNPALPGTPGAELIMVDELTEGAMTVQETGVATTDLDIIAGPRKAARIIKMRVEARHTREPELPTDEQSVEVTDVVDVEVPVEENVRDI